MCSVLYQICVCVPFSFFSEEKEIRVVSFPPYIVRFSLFLCFSSQRNTTSILAVQIPFAFSHSHAPASVLFFFSAANRFSTALNTLVSTYSVPKFSVFLTEKQSKFSLVSQPCGASVYPFTASAAFRFVTALLFSVLSVVMVSDGFGLLARRSIAEAPTDINVTTNSSFVLAADRTYRRDPLNGFRKYPGGWNISEIHYFASVGYTAIPLFAIALVWFVIFFLVMLGICCHHCCCPHRTYKYSRTAYALSLILLILFTCAAIAGCAMLYDGQGKFHKSTTTTLKFVVSQANYTVDNLRNLSDSLSAAKKVDIANSFLLPPNVQSQINEIQGKLNSSATDLAIKTTDNAAKIKKVLNRVRLALIVIAAVMLLLAFVGFLLSIFGLEFLVSVLVVIGWILVTGTFILCGVFLLLHNVVSDTCVAMEEWVAHPTEHTALDEVIPCVEPATANESLYRSRQVTFELVNVVNQVITNVSNRNFPPQLTPFYYNQSGPLMPLLCNPFTPDLRDRSCTRGEVTLDNATQVWKNYECQSKTVSGAEICATVGRVTPSIYGQMAAGVNVSQGLYQYGPFLIQLEDCTFVRDTFTTINQGYCPGLERYSKWVYVGLVMVSAAVMLSLIFWVIYARERRHRVYSKQQHQPYPAEDKPAPTTVPGA